MSDRWFTLHLKKNDLDLVILPGIGGRLWDVIYQGQSLLFQNPDLLDLPIDDIPLVDLPTRSRQFAFPLWGGEKTWIAPDTAWVDGAPFPVLDSAPYRITSQGQNFVELVSQICPISHLSVTRRINLQSAKAWRIEHSVTNHGLNSRPTGIWSVMMINTPAKIGARVDTPKVHSVFGQAGSMVAHTGTSVIADCSTQREFKVGLQNLNGETLIKIGETGPWITCATATPSRDDRFAHQSAFEIFNSGDYPYCEAEWHSPISNLRPEETARFHQEYHVREAGDPQAAITLKELRTCMS